MRYAFSTLGVPGRSVAETAELAAAHGFDGVELRAHPEEPLHPGTPSPERAEAVRTFAAAGVEVLAVAGYAKVAAVGEDEPVVAELLSLIVLAAELGARYVRVFPGGGNQPTADADRLAVRRLAAAAPFAERHGVRLLLETHDSHQTGAAIGRVLDQVGHRAVGALWDVLHTWLGGEAPADTRRALAGHLGYVQVKDVASAGELSPLALGAGALPLAEAVAEAPSDGWLCWEYEKRWYPDAPDLPGLLTGGRAYLAGLVPGGRTDEEVVAGQAEDPSRSGSTACRKGSPWA
ncbi:sugar phosphate isomerase/epimerase family protein [Streptomyces antimicrobicus]|uniref:Sugar phosphate isomerase/epimerase n=1 Tax=Streptomyces antimicrobicus TaxID=2883108 RepID=A0ABS8BEN2_9ACTN|nr:sugar phosphate isomerase/epimerase [Streptomyces antimicrobicus]MCB5182971.1 sugar phosphate isomerase/epimerase [Streptomyces antimicrobicus]